MRRGGHTAALHEPFESEHTTSALQYKQLSSNASNTVLQASSIHRRRAAQTLTKTASNSKTHNNQFNGSTPTPNINVWHQRTCPCSEHVAPPLPAEHFPQSSSCGLMSASARSAAAASPATPPAIAPSAPARDPAPAPAEGAAGSQLTRPPKYGLRQEWHCAGCKCAGENVKHKGFIRRNFRNSSVADNTGRQNLVYGITDLQRKRGSRYGHTRRATHGIGTQVQKKQQKQTATTQAR